VPTSVHQRRSSWLVGSGLQTSEAVVRHGVKSNGLVASIWLKIVSPIDDAVPWVTVRPVIEYSVALELPPTSATGTVSVIVPGLVAR